MQYLDIDPARRYRTRPVLVGSPRPVRAGGSRFSFGRLADFALVAAAGALAAHLGGWPADPIAVVAAALLVALSRWLLAAGWAQLTGAGTAVRRVLVVGDRHRAFEVVATIAAAGPSWGLPVGVLLDRDAPAKPLLGGFIAGFADAERVVAEESVDDIIVALPWADGARLTECLDRLKPLAVDVHLFPDDAAPLAAEGLSLLAGVPMARLRGRPLADAALLVKAVEDRAIAGLLLLLLAPVMAATAVAVKLDSPGPVLFRQQRYGYGNRPFTCLKFRTMALCDDDGETPQATRADPRVTRVGRFLRRASLDELPQLFNVLGGSMSVVGPRPHAVSHHRFYEKVVDDYRCRHRMKPGITGWAQINGFRGETATVDLMKKRVMLDLWYIDHWSLWLDLAILARTPFACLDGSHAY